MRFSGNWKRRAGVVALSAALLGGAAPAATAVASTTQSESAVTAAAADVYHGDFYYLDECNAAGQRGVDAGQWEIWECRDGGPFPWQYYGLYTNR